MLTDRELFWLIGILEGEGYFGHSYSTPTVKVKMNDEDIIRTVSTLFEKIISKPPKTLLKTRSNPKHADSFEVYVYGDNARKIMRLVVPHMHYRRRQRIWQCLNGYRQPKETERPNLLDLLDLGSERMQ